MHCRYNMRSNAWYKRHQIKRLEWFFVSSCSCFCPTHWNQVLNCEWRCNWSSTTTINYGCLWNKMSELPIQLTFQNDWKTSPLLSYWSIFYNLVLNKFCTSNIFYNVFTLHYILSKAQGYLIRQSKVCVYGKCKYEITKSLDMVYLHQCLSGFQCLIIWKVIWFFPDTNTYLMFS